MLSKSPYNAAEAAHQAVELPLQEGSQWQTPAGFALFTAEFGRDGSDLILQGEDGTVLRLADYFDGGAPAEILSHDGASLAGRVVDRLAGPLFPGQYAQAGGFDLAQAIGQVETLTGGAFVQRTDGTTEALDVGIKVFAGDVVRTEGGSTLSITFADGTIFTLAEGSRMVLDELIYDPDATDNKGVFDLVQGGFVFIAGQAASTGGIEINTPAATMGIRGTTVKVDIQLRNGESIVTVSLNTDPDGGTGVIELRDLDGNLIANITQTDTKWIIEPPGTGVPPIEVDRTDLDFAQDSPLLTEAAAAFQLALSRVQQGENFVELPEGNAIDDDQDDDEGEGDGVDPPPTVPPLDETGDDGGTGESGTGNPELDGQDDPLPDGNADTDTEDDAFLDGGEPTTPGSGGDSNPIVTVTSIRSVEDTPFAGNLGVTSNSPDVTVSLTQGAQNGQVVLLSDGTFTYIPNPDFEGTDTFVVTATEPDGSSTESEITVLVDPVNDAPVVASPQDFGSTFEIGTNSEGGSTPAQGTVAYSDVDEGATPGIWSISAAPQNATALGTISIDPTSGAWQYDLDQGAADPLAEGEQVVETYLATITDAEGASDTSTVEVTITGSNDGPVITSSAAQAALGEDVFGFSIEDPESEEDPGEAPSETLATGSVSGSFTFFDVDQGETQGQWSIAPSDANQTTFGSATIDPVTGEWLYTLDQMAADVLGNGDQATEVFIATVTDEFGATASQSITITVTGFNDAPTIEFSIEDITGTVFEEGYVAPDPESESAFQFARIAAMTLEEADATGTLTYTDPDAQPGAQASWAVAPLDASLGTMVIDEITGQWHYFLDQSAAQTLAEGEERTETFTATVTDADGGSSSQVITITVVGSNDEAQIIASPEDLAGAVAEGGALIAQGQLTFVDADAAPGEVSTWSISADGASRGTMIIDPATGAWTYSLDEALANSIGEGGQVTETYTAALTDPLGAVALQTIQITITGENDGPVITSAQLDGTVRETGTTNPGISSISGTLTAVDPDQDGTNLNWQIAPEAGNETALGDMSIDGLSGEWTYLLNNFAADSLALGQSATESFTATVTDAFGASQSTTVVITIEGSADAPVLSADSRTLSEETVEIRVDLAALASDVDNGQDGSTLTYSLLNSPTQGLARIEGTELVFETAGDFDTLIEGQTASVVLNLLATDADGLTATSSISFTVIGTNGAPVFSDASVTLVEETTATLSLDLANLADDPDAGEDGTTLTYSIVNAPTGGSVTLLGTILTFDPGTDFEDLASGESRAVTVDLRATDVDGETATATVTVTVTGANDGPEILATSQTGGSVTEPGAPSASNPVTASGQLFYSDPDEGTTSGTWTITPAGTALGAMTIDPASGQWTYSLDQAAADSLNAGEVRTETFTATVTDVFGADASEEVQITITGTNDAPLLQSDSRLIEGEQGSVTFDLEALASDIDSADLDGTLTFSILTGPAEGTATLDPAGRTLTYATGSDFDDLAEGQTATATITVQVSDSNGASTTADMTVTVTGTNDAPVITSNAAAAAGTVVEPGFEEPGTLSATGQLTYSDVDEGETSGTWSVTAAAPGSLGTIAIDPASGQWTYTLDPASADALDAGDSVTETFEAIYTDAFGAATAPQILTITIEGTNDAPLMTAATLTVDEDTAGTIDLRTLTTDPDASDDPSNDITFGLSGPTEKGTASIVGGILSFDPDGDFDDLAVGDSEEVVLGITLSDPQGGTSTSTVTITVTGTNDGPVITSGPTDAAGTAIESGEGPATPAIVAADATGQLSYVDPDETPTTLGSWSVDAIGPSYGTMNIDSETGAWSYFLSPTLSDSLRQGETVEDRWTAVITDAEGAQAMEVITITITGTNDAPVIDDVTSLTDRGHTEGGPTTLTGQLVANDPDTFVDAPTWTITRADDIDVEEQTYGTMAINNDGLWTYTVDPEAVDMLGEGETAMETFRATVRDEFGQTDEVTVKVRFAGTNSAPELVVDISETDLNVSEAGDGREGSPVAVGQLSYFDNDEGETNGTWSITPTGETTYGSVSINPLTGQWRYELDQEKADSLTEGEQVTETFSATYTDAFGASTAALPLSITISGSNDAPTLTASDLAVSQGGSSSVDLSPLAADVDHALADLTFSISSPPAKGAATMTGGGELTFTTEGAFAGLGDGATEEVDISVVVADPDGATVTQTVTVTVTGTNDAPEIDSDAETFDVSDTLAETDSALTTSGEFDVTDIDEGDIVTVTGITLAATGVLNGAAANDDPTLLGYFSTSPGTVIDAETDSGPLSWTWNSGSEAFDYLATNETLVLTYNIALADDATPPGQVTQEVVITIEGTNDAPVITGSATAALTETADTTGDSATLTATDRLDFLDADLSDVDHTATVSGVTITGASGGLPGNAALLGLLSLTAAKSPSGTDGTIDWTFTAEDQTFDYLAKDETVTLSYEVTLSDGNGGTDTTTVAVTITGSNDLPVAVADTFTVNEDDSVLLGNVLNNDTDPDGDTLQLGSLNNPSPDFEAWNLGTTTNGEVTIFPGTQFQSLAQGETEIATVQYRAEDGNGGSRTSTITINITGVNDAPTLTAGTLNANENTTGAPLDLTPFGDDIDNDDDGDSLTYSIVSGPEEGTVSIEEGVLSFDANGDFEDLGEGETRTVTVDLLATDSHSATSEIVPFSIVVAGVNSAAVITGALSGVITEDEVPNTVGGDLDSVDPDTSDADDSWSAPATPISTTYGSATYDTSGNWVYTLDNGNASVNEMNVGGTLSDSFIATTIDGTEELVSITINGADDAAVISGTDTGTALEDDVAVTGDLNHTDVDNENDLWVVQSSTNTTYGTFDIATDGTWSYEVNNLNAAVDGLNIGDTLTDIVTVSTTGGTLKTIDLTIQGANDPAVISGDISGQVTEDSEIDSAFGQLAHQDPDDDDDLWQSVEVDGSDNGYGTYEITEGGSWTYRLDSSNPTVNALDENGTLTDTFTVTTTGGTDQQITIQISGSNDGPIAVSDTATVTLDKGTLDTTGWTQYGNHFYQFVPEEGGDGGPRFGWAEAQADAVAKGGHLATVTSSAEWAFLSGLHIGQAGWLGGSDEAVEGTWIWVAGPEAGQQFWQGGTGGNTVGGLYANWDASQPDGATEDFLHAFGSGTWNDLADAGQENQIMGYYLEYSGPQATGNLSTNDTTGDGGTLTYSLLGYDEGEGEGETGEFEFDFGSSSSSSTTTTYLLSDDSSGFTLFSDGSWTFDLNSIDFDYLGEGSTTTTSTTYLVTDENGETDTATLTLEITGINNAAVIGGDIDGTISENGEGDTTTGTLTHTDVDQNNDNNLFQVVTDASDTASDQGYGTYSVDSSGYWIYTLNNTNEEIDGLTDGETRTDSFTVLTEDGTEQVVSILIEGQNDRPVTADQTIHVNLANGHFYQLIDVGYTWSQASADAALRGGHLATITSQQEMDFIADIQAGDLLAWLGGSDAAVEGTWRWVEGPEAGQIFWQGAADGSAPVGAYANWMNLQPTGPTLPDEDYAHTWIDEAWNDASAGNPRAYYLEYSDVSGMTVVGNASDVESSDLEFSLVGSYDGLTMQLDGSWALDQSHATYRALGEGQVQTVSATYQVVDEDGGTETAILELILTGVNDTPVAVQDTATTAEDTSVSIDVLDNDSDVDSGDMLVIASLSQPANGTAAVNGAGEVTYTPDRDFNGIDTFTYVASDGSGSTVTESVTVTVTPVDDPVIARADFASTDQDTAVVIDVIANDEDPEDATISVSSVGTAANGLVSLSAGVVTYTPDAEFFGIDTFTYQVTDSTAGNVTQTVTVVVNQDPEEFPIENPPTLSFNLTGGGGSPAGSVTIEVDPVASNGVNIAFGLDESGSITGGQFVTMIDSVKLAVANLVADFAGSSTSLDVHITPFDGDVDTSGPMQPQSFTVHTAAGVTNLTAFNSYMDAVKAAYNGGSTNWDAAFLDLKTFFDAQESTAPDDVNVAYFITDGNPNASVTTPTWQTTTTALRAPPLDVDIKAFAIGSNVTTSNLSLIDPDFDAATQTLASANDLTAAFDASPLFNARLADFSLVLFRDGESVGEIADETIFTTPLTGIAFELPLADIQGLSGLLGDDNLFIATAKFDTDGNLGTTADVLQIVTQGSLSKATTSQNLTGTSESDLLLGGGLDDTLVGLDGNDVLMGFGGSDSILGGLGNDSITTSGTGAQMIDGGAGRDVLTFQTDADITSSVLTALNIQNVEALNITNNENNILTLTADRAAGLPSIAGDLLSVLGETGDTVVLEDSATRFFRTSSGGSITDSNGNVLDIYAIEDGSGAIISAVAVDQDTAVSFISDPAHTEGDGDLPFFYTEFDESEGGPVLEIGTEAGLGSGTATVDLSGIEALAPDILKDVAVIDMRNGQANELSIDAADLLNIIEGNDASENEYIWIQIDPEDTVTLVDDGGVPGSEGWDAESQAGNPNVYDISDTGGFGAYADTFATIFIDDGSPAPT